MAERRKSLVMILLNMKRIKVERWSRGIWLNDDVLRSRMGSDHTIDT